MQYFCNLFFVNYIQSQRKLIHFRFQLDSFFVFLKLLVYIAIY